MSVPPFLDSGMGDLPAIPDSSEPRDIAEFVVKRQTIHNKVLMRHFDERFNELRTEILAGFPLEDPTVTRQLLEAILKKEENKAKFWEHLRRNLAEKGMWAVVLAVVGTAWWTVTTWWMYKTGGGGG